MWRKKEGGRRKKGEEVRSEPKSDMMMVALRVWLWLVPIGMLVAATVFSVVAALDGRWALLGAMVLIGLFAVGLMVLHLWAMYGFGRTKGE